MKKITLILIIAFCGLASKAQSVDTLLCDAPDRDTTEFENLPWFGNNVYLENFLDSISYPSEEMYQQNTSRAVGINGIVGPERIRFHVPVKFWVYRNGAGIGGPSLQQLQQYIGTLNKYYNVDNNTLIGFYMRCEIGYINDDSHLDIENDLEAGLLLQNHKESGCINIHIVNNLQGATVGVQIRARFFGIDGIFLNRSTYTIPALYNTIAHEVGHYFDLDHTHQYSDNGKCRKEAIDRMRTYPIIQICPFKHVTFSNVVCESTGDGLRDTQADPDLITNFSCDYLLGGNDPWGDSYTNPPHGISERPNTHNIMSYNGDRTCIDVFSRLQIAVMLHSIYRGKSNNNRTAWGDSRGEYDDYEMDNFSETARPILLNEIQERNFNQQYYGDGIWAQCDVDWISFVPSCDQTFDIQTSTIAGRTNANTRLTIFDASLNQLAQNDDISVSNHFSKITLNLTSGQTYLIRVDNMGSTVTGYYNLNVAQSLAINGDNSICNSLSNNYTISNLPPGATVQWQVSPFGIATPNTQNLTQTTLGKNGNGIITLTATITNACSGSPVIINKEPIVVGKPQPGSITFDLIDPVMGKIQSRVDPIPGAISYNWYKNGVLITGSLVHDAFIQFTIPKICDVEYDIAVEAVNSCGISLRTSANAYVPCDSYFMISPNPATSSITISGTNDKSYNASSSKTITGVSIYDNLGNLKKHQNFSKAKTATLQVSGLISGVYVVEISDGVYKERHQVIIAK